jgi:hypothetical protein
MRYINGCLELNKKEVESFKYALITLENDMNEIAANQIEFPDKKWLCDASNAYYTIRNVGIRLGITE